MSTSRSRSESTRRSLARSYAKVKYGSTEPEPSGSRRGSQSSYIPQVVEKVKALNIEESEHAESGNIQTKSISVHATIESQAGPDVTAGQPPATHPAEQTPNADNPTGATRKKFKNEEFAKDMCNPIFIRDYFSNVVEHPATDAVDENIDERDASISTPVEISKAQSRGEYRFSQVCSFPLRLILTPISQGGIITKTFSSLLGMEFGPLHAALQVGDVILEWNDSSLVIPNFSEHDDPLLKADIQHLAGWVDFTKQHTPKMKKAAENLDYPGQIDLIFHATAEKSRLIDNLVKVIVDYNRYHYYNLIDRNCQHFVCDALKALGVEKPIQFTGGLGKYYKALKSGCSQSMKFEFSCHAELDKYVKNLQSKGDLESMPKEDLEFLLATYFKFHLDERRKYKDDPVALENWRCTERACLMQELESRIQLKSLAFHQFKTVH